MSVKFDKKINMRKLIQLGNLNSYRLRNLLRPLCKNLVKRKILLYYDNVKELHGGFTIWVIPLLIKKYFGKILQMKIISNFYQKKIFWLPSLIKCCNTVTQNSNFFADVARISSVDWINISEEYKIISIFIIIILVI